MKTQISKKSVDALKRYAGVYQQQGRMLTDADWNSLVDILKAQLAEALKDVVGNGTPRSGALAIADNRNIQPGDVYIDGLRAVLPGTTAFAAGLQPDLPGSGDLPATGPYVVYADVWERALTALEDPDLRDVALNGADTCTRTQAMLQVKTCGGGVNPETDIPQKGNAALSLDLHDNLEASDPCDPCAGLVGAGAGRVGNYLFRLEVHAVAGAADSPTALTLKWSSENGAEQFSAQAEGLMPPGFVNARFLYEFFDSTTEKHAGVHLTSGFSPRAGILNTTYAIPDGVSDPKAFVRRWDGYCELSRSGSSWTLVDGWDKGVDLSTGISSTQPGYVALGPGLTVNLEAFRMNLELSGRTFVVGDYWLAAVREAVHTAGSAVCSGTLPDGIDHHFLRLAGVAADGTVTRHVDDADRRRHSFPPLTDLHAHDIDYQTGCTQGLFLNFEGTVKQALDTICSIQAEHVGYPKPCNTSLYRGQPIATVADALGLLCDIRARHVAYTPGACAFLNQPNIETVQDAIDALCQRPAGGGCKVTIGPDGQFPSIAAAVKALTAQGIFDICLCLLRGEHALERVEKEKDFPHLNLSLTGCGPGTRIQPSGSAAFIGIDVLHLADLWVVSLAQERLVAISGCGVVDLDRVHHVGMAAETVLLAVSGTAAFSMNHCTLEAHAKAELSIPAAIFAFDADLAALFAHPERRTFLAAAGLEAQRLAKLNANGRRKIAEQLQAALETAGKLSRNERLSYERLLQVLVLSETGKTHFLDALGDIRDQAHHATAGGALLLADALARVSILNSRIYGQVSLYGASGDSLSEEEIKQLQQMLASAGVLTLVAQAADLSIQGTMLTRLALASERVDEIRQIIEAGKGVLTDFYKAILISDSMIAWNGNLLLSADVTLDGNTMESLHTIVGSVIAETVVYSGNRVQRRIRNNEWVGGGRLLTAARDAVKAANMPEGSW
ncbi:conserved hypothetical protein [Desulfosarcina cetonica]|nr:conserved hypothetical protein [Desulfosarcina cetonica]